MKCPDMGTLQAYIDGEMDIISKKDIEGHLSSCPKCRDAYNELKNNDDFAFSKINSYRQFFVEELSVRTTPESNKKIDQNKRVFLRGAYRFMTNYRKIAAVAGIALAITACVTVQPVRSAIASTLSIFRVENVKSINISLKDLQEIQKKIEMKQKDIKIDNFGEIKMEGGKKKPASIEDVKKVTDFKVLFPTELKETEPNIEIVEPSLVNFKLNVDNVNSILKTFDANTLLPKSVDGKTFSAKFSSQVFMNYKKENKQLAVVQLKSPEIIVPDDVNVDDIYNSIVGLPILPKDLQAQLKSIKDWKNTLYFPVINNDREEISINGAKGYVSSGKLPIENTERSSVIWYDNGVIYAINGNISKDEIIKLAKSMR